MKIDETQFYSRKIGSLAKGCRQCVKGEKLVLFITGICPRKCYYCPINDKKYQNDKIYANEMSVKKISDVILEAKLCSAKGVGITGGDPLSKLDRTVNYIKALKKKFGSKFHIHLYTSFDLVDSFKLTKLSDAGLDEIRFHADIDSSKIWSKIFFALEHDWDIGIEIPVVPGKIVKTKKLIDYFSDKVDFFNFNELEVADNKMSKLSKMGFLTKDKVSYAVKKSETSALKLMNHIISKKYKLNVHFCTAKLKDKVQLGERLKKRAKNIAKEYDVVDSEGILIRGVIYSKNLKKVHKELMKEFDIPATLIEVEDERILTGAWIVDELKEELNAKGLRIAIVEEFPTWDKLQITVNFL